MSILPVLPIWCRTGMLSMHRLIAAFAACAMLASAEDRECETLLRARLERVRGLALKDDLVAAGQQQSFSIDPGIPSLGFILHSSGCPSVDAAAQAFSMLGISPEQRTKLHFNSPGWLNPFTTSASNAQGQDSLWADKELTLNVISELQVRSWVADRTLLEHEVHFLVWSCPRLCVSDLSKVKDRLLANGLGSPADDALYWQKSRAFLALLALTSRSDLIGNLSAEDLGQPCSRWTEWFDSEKAAGRLRPSGIGHFFVAAEGGDVGRGNCVDSPSKPYIDWPEDTLAPSRQLFNELD